MLRAVLWGGRRPVRARWVGEVLDLFDDQMGMRIGAWNAAEKAIDEWDHL